MREKYLKQLNFFTQYAVVKLQFKKSAFDWQFLRWTFGLIPELVWIWFPFKLVYEYIESFVSCNYEEL